MHGRVQQALVITTILVVTMLAGVVGMRQLQSHVKVLPGLRGCWTLSGMSKQVDCTSEWLFTTADDVVTSSNTDSRNAQMIAFVRSVDTRAATDAQLAGVCHPAMHVLGRAEGRRAAAVQQVPPLPDAGAQQLCTAGFVHGAVEGWVAASPNADVNTAFSALCVQNRERPGCAHGLGHAMLQAQTADEAGVARALARCSALPAPYPTNCSSGVFMEAAMQRPAMKTSTYIALCQAQSRGVDRLNCANYLDLNLSTHDVPVAEHGAYCEQLPRGLETTCMSGWGRQLGVEGLETCASASRTVLTQLCIDGAIGLPVGSGHITAAEATTRCEQALADDLAAFCKRAVQRYSAGRSTIEQ